MVKQAPLKLRDQQICVSVLLPNKAYFKSQPTQPSLAQHSPPKSPYLLGCSYA